MDNIPNVVDHAAVAKERVDTSTRRATPAQRRSELTYERILDTSLEILGREGLAGFNTNAVAAAANINISTLYHYFSDKNAVLRELFIRTETARISYLASRVSELATVTDLATWVSDLISTLSKMRQETPGISVLRSALRVLPELRELEVQLDRQSVTALADVLRTRYPKLSADRAALAATTVIDVGVMVMDRSSEGRVPADAQNRELSQMITAYFTSLE